MSNPILVSKVSIDEKSFSKYSGPEPSFNQYNILFGLNGHGKSTLARNIRATALSDGTPSEDIRIYNAQYIQDTLLLKEKRGKITSVNANFGAENTGIEEQVATLEGEIAKLDEKLNGVNGSKGLFAQSQDCLRDIQTEIKTIHSANKGKTTIKLKFSAANPFEVKILEAYNMDYVAGLKKFKQEIIETSSGNDDHEGNLNRINGIKLYSVEPVNILPAQGIKDAVKIMQKTYGNSIPGTNEIDWLVEGLHIHEQAEKCKFCLGDVNIEEVRQRVTVYKEDSKVTDMLTLKGVAATLDAYLSCAESLISSKAAYRELYETEDDYLDDFNMLEAYLIALEDFRSMIQQKLEKNDFTVELSEEYYYTASSLIEDYCSDLKSLKQLAVTSVTDLINLQNILVRARIGHDIVTNELITEKKEEYDKVTKSVLSAAKEIKEKNNEIKLLKSKKSKIANFANYVNGILHSLGFDFKLVVDNEDVSYELKHVNNTPILIDDISEGEKNLLALLYFYFEMLQDDEKNIKTNIQLVIIDDPIASLDDDNRFYILETVKSLLDNQSAQVFVFTHLWSNFCDLTFGKNGNASTNLYEIVKTNSKSNILVSTAQEQPYKRMYAEIWAFSQADINSIDADTFLHMPNTIRRVLEDYMRFYAGIKNATSNTKEQISRALLDEEYLSLSSKNRLRLTTLLSVANILSHRVPGSPSKKEIHDSAKFFMNKMSLKHKHHHDAMKTLHK